MLTTVIHGRARAGGRGQSGAAGRLRGVYAAKEPDGPRVASRSRRRQFEGDRSSHRLLQEQRAAHPGSLR